MIKGITLVRPVDSPAQLEQLVSFFSALGFEPGKGWNDPSGASGHPFLAPLGNLEFVHGKLPNLSTHWLVEVTSLDDVHRGAAAWMKNASRDPVTPIEETHWKSRVFTAEPVPGYRIAFWEWLDPLHGKPIALEGDLSAAGMRFAIVAARWNAVITDRLLQGALDALLRSGAHRRDIEVVRVPGSWEIRGETAHYEAIYNEVARGIGQSQQETGIPHAFGVLTCETLEQALDRAGVKSGNKGFEAAAAAIEMASVYRKIADQPAFPQQPAHAAAGAVETKR
jgi:6,7-dimethyl-8-ribityllumazine synthase